jgi:hypothetical protein
MDAISTINAYRDVDEVPILFEGVMSMLPIERNDLIAEAVKWMRNDWQTVIDANEQQKI